MKVEKKKSPFVDGGNDAVTIGQFTISQMSEGALWIEDGEEDAMPVSEEELAAAIKAFYDSKF